MSEKKRKPKPRDLITRYGPRDQSTVSFAKEERFAWQKAKFQSDVVYDVKPEGAGRSVIFSGSLREDACDNPDAKKRSTGPGSYDVSNAPNFISEYIRKGGNRFASAARESMAVKTPSPGPVYTIEGCFFNGVDRGKKISFNCDKRKPLHEGTPTDADMLWPQLSKGPSVTIAKRIPQKVKGSDTPGPYQLRPQATGPQFSFGKGRGDRFCSFGILKGFES